MPIIAPDIAVDLGSANTMVYVRDKGILVDEPSIVLIKPGIKKNTTVAFGEDAKMLIGRTHGEYKTVYPVRDSSIEDADLTQYMLEYYIRKAIGSSRLVRPRCLVAVPTHISNIERNTIIASMMGAGVRKGNVRLLDKPIAAALGCDLPVFEPKGSMVVDVGCGSTEAAVISYGGIVVSSSAKVGGAKMDLAMRNFVKREFNADITPTTAETVKCDIGSAMPVDAERKVFLRCRDNASKKMRTIEMTASMAYEALQPICREIIAVIHEVLELTPPELAGDVMRSGIHMTGGGSLLSSLDRFIASELSMQVIVTDDPMACTIKGLGVLTDEPSLQTKLIDSYQRPRYAK